MNHPSKAGSVLSQRVVDAYFTTVGAVTPSKEPIVRALSRFSGVAHRALDLVERHSRPARHQIRSAMSVANPRHTSAGRNALRKVGEVLADSSLAPAMGIQRIQPPVVTALDVVDRIRRRLENDIRGRNGWSIRAEVRSDREEMTAEFILRRDGIDHSIATLSAIATEESWKQEREVCERFSTLRGDLSGFFEPWRSDATPIWERAIREANHWARFYGFDRIEVRPSAKRRHTPDSSAPVFGVRSSEYQLVYLVKGGKRVSLGKPILPEVVEKSGAKRLTSADFLAAAIKKRITAKVSGGPDAQYLPWIPDAKDVWDQAVANATRYAQTRGFDAIRFEDMGLDGDNVSTEERVPSDRPFLMCLLTAPDEHAFRREYVLDTVTPHGGSVDEPDRKKILSPAALTVRMMHQIDQAASKYLP